jgi:hypothetical protein
MKGRSGMLKKHFYLSTVIMLLFAVSGAASPQEPTRGRVGIGFQTSFPAWGLSGVLDITDKLSVQGIFGVIGDFKTFAGRGIFRFKTEPYWNPYGYGTIGAWRYTGWEIGDDWSLDETTEMATGFGGGLGLEYNWQAWSSKLPPLWWNLELGFSTVEFEEVDFNFSALTVGAGVHFRF